MRFLPVILVLAGTVVAVSAGPLGSPDPEELVRRGNEAVLRGDLDTAERLYIEAAERTTDPGLVAFNRATIAFHRGDLRQAELDYLRSLDDQAAASDRRARAQYNRGVCLLTRGGAAAVYRTAVACFEQAVDLAGNDAVLAADARHNLELAKLLWNRARSRERTPPKPNDLPPDAPDHPPIESRPPNEGSDPGSNEGTGGASSRSQMVPGSSARGGQPRETQQQTPGAGSLPVVLDGDRPDKLSPDDARALLRHHAGRIDRDRKTNARLSAGPELPHVRDW